MAQIIRETDYLHPLMRAAVQTIQRDVIERHRLPFRLFETARTPARQLSLYNKRKVRTLASYFYFDLKGDPVIHSTAVCFVHFTDRWSWDIRTRTTKRWYELFGELVLDACPDLDWAGNWRSNIDYTHFQLKQAVRLEHGIPSVRMKGSSPETGDEND